MILTPDRWASLAPEREAVRRAVELLGPHRFVVELGARPHPPRELYRSYLEISTSCCDIARHVGA